MKFRALVYTFFLVVAFTIGFLSGDVYRHLASESNRRTDSVSQAQLEKEFRCSKGDLISAERLSESTVVKVLSALWGPGYEQTFSVVRLAEFEDLKFRFFLDSDIGGIVTFCNFGETDAYVGFVEKSQISIGELNDSATMATGVYNISEPWVILTTIDDNRVFGVSNAFGLDAVNFLLMGN